MYGQDPWLVIRISDGLRSVGETGVSCMPYIPFSHVHLGEGVGGEGVENIVLIIKYVKSSGNW